MFDSHEIGNTTAGFKPYTMQLLANGLRDVLKIQKTDVLDIPSEKKQLSNL